MNLNKTFLVLIMLSFLFLFTCRDSDDGGDNGGKNGGSAMMYDYECQNGTPQDGLALTPNDNKCQSCNEGYSLENMSCTIPATPAGMGTEASPYVLLNYAHLKTMGNALNKHYKLGATIDARDSWSEGAMGCSAYAGDGQLNVTGVCSNTAYTTEMDCTAPRATWTSGSPGSCSNTAHTTEMDCTAPRGSWTDLTCTGWVPVGDGSDNTDATEFTGSLDGNGYIISNLYVYVKASATAYGGLFGVTGSGAEIKNLGLTNIYVNTTAFSSALINLLSAGGGLVGENRGAIINSYATGSVTVTVSSSSASHGGGLVGRNDGGGSIINSYATGSVTVSTSSRFFDPFGGGLVGRNHAGGSIINSYATGRVAVFASSSLSNSNGGGLVGENQKTIENSYAAGRAACIADETCHNPQFGGLVGQNVATHGGTISGTNYFVFNDTNTEDDDDGVGSGGCAMGATCAERTLAQLQALNEGTALGWNTTAWDVSTTAFAKLKYVEYVAGFCSDPAHTTQTDCTAPRGTWESGSCSDSSLIIEATCIAPRGTWRTVAACETIASNDKAVNQGTPTPDCGDLIAGQ